jgi:hypothetical protein
MDIFWSFFGSTPTSANAKGLDPQYPNPASSSSTSPFLRIPVELRLYIYRHLLVSPITIGEPRPRDFGKIHPGILRTNRQIHNEARSILYAENTFRLFLECLDGDSYHDRVFVYFASISYGDSVYGHGGIAEAATKGFMPIHMIRRLEIVVSNAGTARSPDKMRHKLSREVTYLCEHRVPLALLRVRFVRKCGYQPLLLRPLCLLRGISRVELPCPLVDPQVRDEEAAAAAHGVETLIDLMQGDTLPRQWRSYKVLRAFARAVSRYYPAYEHVALRDIARAGFDPNRSPWNNPSDVDDALRALEDDNRQGFQIARAQVIRHAVRVVRVRELSTGFQDLDPCEFGEYRGLVAAEEIARGLRGSWGRPAAWLRPCSLMPGGQVLYG